MDARLREATSRSGTPIAFWTSGKGPPLVLAHGTGAPHARWPAVAALENHFTVHAMQRRGRGHSGDSEPYALDREFEDVAAVVDEVGEPVFLMGHSYGALCAIGATFLTSNVRKLVVYEPPAYSDGTGSLVIGVPPETGLDVDGLLAGLQARMEEGREAGVTFFLRTFGGMSPEMVNDPRSQPTWQARLEAAPTILREMRHALGHSMGPERLRQIGVPTFSLVGEESPAWRRDSAEDLAALLPDAQVFVLPGQGHAAMFDAPGLFARTLVELLLP